MENRLNRPETLLLSHEQIVSILTFDVAIDAVRRVMQAHGEGAVIEPNLLHADAPRGEFHIKTGGILDGEDGGVFGLKANGGFFQNRRLGLPNIIGLIVLADARTGAPVAVLDSVEISRVRTGAATAVAALHLARPESETVTVIGTGTQAGTQIEALCHVLPIRQARLVGRDIARTRERAALLESRLDIEVVPMSSAEDALLGSDVLVTCTPAQEALVSASEVPEGLFIAAVGADSPGKQELDPQLVAQHTTVADILSQCIHVGELQHPIRAGLIGADDVHAELGQILCGARPGRTREEEITIYDSTGTALQDVAVGAMVYEEALRRAIGESMQFGGASNAAAVGSNPSG